MTNGKTIEHEINDIKTNVAVGNQRLVDLKDDMKEVKSMVRDKVATKEYVDDRVNPLKKLVYWQLALVGALFLSLIGLFLGSSR